MKIVVCVKRVPEIDQIKVANDRIEASGAGMTNPFDMYAIEEAIRIKEKTSGEVIALTVGSEDSDLALREALSIGVDSAVRVWQDDIKESDILATAGILSAAIEKIGDVDLAIFGKQAVDDDASSVSGAVGGFLGFPQVLFVKKIREIDEGKLVAERATEDGFDIVETSLPAVISVVKEINEPRLPSLKGKMKAKKAPIEVLGLADIGLETTAVGAASPSRQIKAEEPPPRPAGEILQGSSPEELADALIAKLKEEKLI
ncbi:MAG: electron transfer flavoprotein subunit beta [candidate division Zixibacteria bacterium]|nr:electron transfer flavoprotein subunit beta [candidate division Zixibacteria bacterium]